MSVKIETRLIDEIFVSVMGECDLDVTGVSSISNIIRSDVKKNGQFPDDLVKIEDTQSHYGVSRTY
jgi:hypothetical protein